MFPKIQFVSPADLQKLNLYQWPDKILLEGEVAAGEMTTVKRHIDQSGHWYNHFITGTFTTLYLDGEVIKDDGVDHLRFQLSDTTGNKKNFSDFIPGSHFLSPGREKSAISAAFLTDPLGTQLFYPNEYYYTWEKNSDVLLEVKNDSNTTNYFKITLHGWRINAVS